VVQQDYDDATKLPASHVAEKAETSAAAYEAWAKARANNDFSLYQPLLERMVDLARETAEYRGYDDNPYDALVTQFEREMSADEIKTIFDAHRADLVHLAEAISEAAPVDDSMLHQPFPLEQQQAFGRMVTEAIGFDFNRGRQDETVHPFATNFSVNDVRITTRYNPEFLNPALFGLMHEAGHGMYEQGVSQDLEGTPLARGTSLSVHESQSRMWENLVGRSRNFWQWALPKLKATFPEQMGAVDLDSFHRAINKVQRSFIRVEADEATYNLHIMLRFELEDDLINDRVKVADLPQVWNERFERDLGVVPPTDALGVLQDVHWSAGLLGYFPTYALGNLLSVQYYNRALQDHPSIPDEITEGKFDTLLHWLRENIHQHGRKFNTDELTRRVTGTGIDPRPYVDYLKDKYSTIYGL
jgi:carboxypeptidase Taq